MYKERNEEFFRQVLDKATKQAKNEPSTTVDVGQMFIPLTGRTVNKIEVSQLLNDTINKANEVYLSSHELAKKEKNSRVNEFDCLAGTAAYTAYTLNVMCTREAIAKQIDAVLSDPENQDWLEENGISSSDIAPLSKELKDYTLEALKTSERTKPMAEFIEATEKKIEKTPFVGAREDLLKKMGIYVLSLDNHLDEVSYRLKKNNFDAKDELFTRPAFLESDNAISWNIGEGFDYDIMNYTRNLGIAHDVPEGGVRNMGNFHYTDINKKPLVEDLCKDLGVMLESQTINIISNDEVQPIDFIEHYQKGKLTKAESEWAHKRCEDIFFSVGYKFNKEDSNHHQMVDMNGFYANGKQIISDDEMKEALSGSGDKMRKLEEKLVAAVLSGDDITVKSHDKSMQTTLKPVIDKPKKAEFKFGQIFQWIYDAIFSGKDKKIEKVNALNAKFEKNAYVADATRVKMSFNELANTTAAKTVRPGQPKNERTKEMNSPQK